MLLIIPALHIREGKCYPKIDYYRDHGLPPCESPIEEPRLLRKENAKALHLFFDGTPAYSKDNLAIIRQIRTCIDLPLGVTIDSGVSTEELQQLSSSGIYRVFLKCSGDEPLLQNALQIFTAQRLCPHISMEDSKLPDLPKLKSIGFSRLVIEFDNSDDPVLLSSFVQAASKSNLRLTLISSVLSYAQLMTLDGLTPTVDSLILNDTLEHDPFPCQAIWRTAEERAFLSVGKEANLWKNPLEGTVHR